MCADARTFVIIGAAQSGASAAQALRVEGYTGRIILIGAERDPPYLRPPLSKAYLRGDLSRDRLFVNPAAHYAAHDIELLLGRRAVGMDRAARTVVLEAARGRPRERVRYDKLLLATGSHPGELDIPGADLAGVHQLYTLEQADALRSAVLSGPDGGRGVQAVVVGAGWTGLEAAAALRGLGAQVTVVDSQRAPLCRVLGLRLAGLLRDVHLAHGVRFRLGTEVRCLGGLAGEVTHAVLSDDTEIPADLVLAATEAVPATELAAGSGIEVADGVLTDAALRTSDPDVYACGDICRVRHRLLPGGLRAPYWSAAVASGAAAARSMLGVPVSYAPLPSFSTEQYTGEPRLELSFTGHLGPGDGARPVLRGEPIVGATGPQLLAFWLRDGRMTAAMSVNMAGFDQRLAALVCAGLTGRTVDPSRLADPGVDLDTLLR